MDASNIASLRKEFPDRAVFADDPDTPKEIVVELQKTMDFSLAIAVIDESRPHFHRLATETYHVLEGTLDLMVDGVHERIGPGTTRVISPGRVHSAKGSATRVEVTCSPPWTPEDHILSPEI